MDQTTTQKRSLLRYLSREQRLEIYRLVHRSHNFIHYRILRKKLPGLERLPPEIRAIIFELYIEECAGEITHFINTRNDPCRRIMEMSYATIFLVKAAVNLGLVAVMSALTFLLAMPFMGRALSLPSCWTALHLMFLLNYLMGVVSHSNYYKLPRKQVFANHAALI